MGYKASQPTGRESGRTDFASSGHGKSLPLPGCRPQSHQNLQRAFEPV
jgi:hypothetical protein